MQGDVSKTHYQGLIDTYRKLWSQGGVQRFYRGASWRAVNIVGTIYIANFCRMHLSALFQ